MNGAREEAIERLAAELWYEGDDEAGSFIDGIADRFAGMSEDDAEKADAYRHQAARVMSKIGLVAIDTALIDAVKKASDGSPWPPESLGYAYDVQSAKVALADAVLAQLRGGIR